MYSTTTSRGRTSVSPTPSGGGRRSTRAARGSTSSRRARSAAAKSGYNASSPYGSSLTSDQQRDGFLHGQLNRRSEPARRWVEVMRPPAPHIKFLVAKWVPLKDLTEEEREEYEKRKMQRQEEKLRRQSVATDEASSQPAESFGVGVAEEQNNPSLATPVQPTPTSAATGQTGTPEPMAISPPPENVDNKRKLAEREDSTFSTAEQPSGEDVTTPNSSEETKRRKLNDLTHIEPTASIPVDVVESSEATPAASIPVADANEDQPAGSVGGNLNNPTFENSALGNQQQNELSATVTSNPSNPPVEITAASDQQNEAIETTTNNQDNPTGGSPADHAGA